MSYQSRKAEIFQILIDLEINAMHHHIRSLIDNKCKVELEGDKAGILKAILCKFLPKNISIGTGVIYTLDNVNSNNIDIIIYDNTKPSTLIHGDYIIVPIMNVIGIVKVKDGIVAQRHIDWIIRDFNCSISPFISKTNPKNIFLGIFIFKLEEDIDVNQMKETISETCNSPNHISLGPNYFIKYWKKNDLSLPNPPIENKENDINIIYKTQDLSFSYFIRNLINMVCAEVGEKDWCSFPFEEGEKANRHKIIRILPHS